jgi:hypothetical protein
VHKAFRRYAVNAGWRLRGTSTRGSRRASVGLIETEFEGDFNSLSDELLIFGKACRRRDYEEGLRIAG